MTSRRSLMLAPLALLALGGCGSTSLFGRDQPDEFAVQRQAPLIVPPDFALAPPQPGAARPGSESTAEQTLRALFGGAAPRSGVEGAAVQAAGATRADPGIRTQVGSPDTNVVDKGLVTRDIIAAPQGDGQEATVTTPQ